MARAGPRHDARRFWVTRSGSPYKQLMAGNTLQLPVRRDGRPSDQSCGGGGAPAFADCQGHAGTGVTASPPRQVRAQKAAGVAAAPTLRSPRHRAHALRSNQRLGTASPRQSILSHYVTVMAKVAASRNPKVIFLPFCEIGQSPIPVAPAAALRASAWATAANTTAVSPITIINHYDSAFDPTKRQPSCADGVHPTPVGTAIMATVTLQHHHHHGT